MSDESRKVTDAEWKEIEIYMRYSNDVNPGCVKIDEHGAIWMYKDDRVFGCIHPLAYLDIMRGDHGKFQINL